MLNNQKYNIFDRSYDELDLNEIKMFNKNFMSYFDITTLSLNASILVNNILNAKQSTISLDSKNKFKIISDIIYFTNLNSTPRYFGYEQPHHIKFESEINKLYYNKHTFDTNDIKRYNYLINDNVISILKSQSTNRIEKIDDTIYNDKTSKKPKTESKDLIFDKNHSNQYNKYLEIINQEVIDQLGLTIFDVILLRMNSEILLVFVDGDNRKRYYKEPFNFKYVVSQHSDIKDNNHITIFKEDSHQTFLINNLNDYYKLRKSIGVNFENEVSVV